MNPTILKSLIVTIALVALSGCATNQVDQAYNDPFEGVNRAVLEFNLESDRVILKPIAKTYSKVVPGPIRSGINNFFSNLWEPMTIVNDLLQGKLDHAAQDTMRFLVNSTIGVFGILDVATEMDMPRRKEDFGQTLAVWGVPSGPYLVLPFLGPSNLRDTAGLVPQWVYADALIYLDSPESYYAVAARLVDGRSTLLGADDILDLQPDKYLFLREAYQQNRNNLIHDGNPPSALQGGSEDDLIDQLLEEE